MHNYTCQKLLRKWIAEGLCVGSNAIQTFVQGNSSVLRSEFRRSQAPKLDVQGCYLGQPG